jgi:SAM-dependent methyltransferase
VEFGSYRADLPLWVELAAACGGPVLELGAGAGRVALHLAGHGHEVIALDRDPELAAELERRARLAGLRLSVVVTDLSEAESILPPSPPAIVLAPLHVIQELGAEERRALLAALRGMLRQGLFAAALVDENTMLTEGLSSALSSDVEVVPKGQILPDMKEVEGWVYSSEPLWVHVGDSTLTVRRLRERVSPEGKMERSVHDDLLERLSPDRLELELEEAGLRPAGRRAVRAGPNEADSVVVVAEAR